MSSSLLPSLSVWTVVCLPHAHHHHHQQRRRRRRKLRKKFNENTQNIIKFMQQAVTVTAQRLVSRISWTCYAGFLLGRQPDVVDYGSLWHWSKLCTKFTINRRKWRITTVKLLKHTLVRGGVIFFCGFASELALTASSNSLSIFWLTPHRFDMCGMHFLWQLTLHSERTSHKQSIVS